MQKIYVLLRHNQQTGPYSLEEIIQFDLKPYDLIWIEGRSAGWYYPQEIGALYPYLSFLPKKEPAIQADVDAKHVFVATPASQKEEPVQLQPALKAETPVTQPEVMHTSFRPASSNIEEQIYAQFRKNPEKEEPATTSSFSQSPANKKPVGSFGIALAIVLVVGGVFSASWLMNRQPQLLEQETTGASPAPPELAATNIDDNAAVYTPSSRSTSAQKQEKGNAAAKQATVGNVSVATSKKRKQVLVDPSSSEEDDTPAIFEEEEIPVEGKEPSEASTETGTEGVKKKKLRDKIFDLFKKKPEEKKQEEVKPDADGERNASRRNEGISLSQSVHIRFTVPNDWMMGIIGAKATLLNRSNHTITNATVEVQYYNDDNELLQKKIITFGKVEGKGSRTLAIPDHPSATKVDYSIVSVTGQPAA